VREVPLRLDIQGLAWTLESERHVEEHINAWEIADLIEGQDFYAFANTKGHAPNRYRCIGRTPSGEFVTAILQEAHDGDPTQWIVITGWQSTATERDMYERERARITRKQGGQRG
jgi:hypothetical protein